LGLRYYFIAGALFSLFLGLTFIPDYGYASNAGFSAGAIKQFFPGPDLFYPVTNDINLESKGYLEFKWRRSDFYSTRSYDFRLYKGYQTTLPNLLIKKSIAIGEYPYRIPSDNLEEGEVYTWVLIQVLTDGRKSDKSFSSFRIIKK